MAPSRVPVVNRSVVVPAGTVYFVRHGLVHNPNRLAYGWLPRFRLAEEGRRQVEATARFLAGAGAKLILTSPLLRAVQTTRLVAAALPGVSVRRSRLLIESGLAQHWQGTPWTVLHERFPGDYQLWQDDPGAVEAGESMAAMALRMQAAMAEALRLSHGGPAVSISHRDPILALRLWIEGSAFERLHTTACNPASVTVIRSEQGRLTVAEYAEPYQVTAPA